MDRGRIYDKLKAMAEKEIIWEAPEFEYREKGAAWYWLSMVVAIVILVLAVWQKNFLFGVFVIIAEILLIVWGNQQPRMISFKLGETGLTINNTKTYAYKDIENYAFDEEGEEWVSAIFKLRRQFRPKLKAILPKEMVGEVKALLKTRAADLMEVEWEQSLIDSLERLIGF